MLDYLQEKNKKFIDNVIQYFLKISKEIDKLIFKLRINLFIYKFEIVNSFLELLLNIKNMQHISVILIKVIR